MTTKALEMRSGAQPAHRKSRPMNRQTAYAVISELEYVMRGHSKHFTLGYKKVLNVLAHKEVKDPTSQSDIWTDFDSSINNNLDPH